MIITLRNLLLQLTVFVAAKPPIRLSSLCTYVEPNHEKRSVRRGALGELKNLRFSCLVASTLTQVRIVRLPNTMRLSAGYSVSAL